MAPPPPLVDDVVSEILSRLPPDDPACLVRASLVCKSWRRILSDPAFLRYRASYHGAAPPVLGFFHGRSFFPTATAPPISPPDLWILDCRHGRVLGRTCDCNPSSLVVREPVTGVERQRLPLPEYRPSLHFTAAVLCASAAAAPGACDHLDCRGGPFLVLFVATDGKGGAWACLYTSDTGAWGTPTPTVHLGLGSVIAPTSPSLLAGDALHFTFAGKGNGILRYDLGRRVLSAIKPAPPPPLRAVGKMIPFTADGGGGLLGVAGVVGRSSLHLWSWQEDRDGGAWWAQHRVVELDLSIGAAVGALHVAGFAEGARVIFLCSDAGAVFTLQLESGGQVRKVVDQGGEVFYKILPYECFYTIGAEHASGKSKPLVRMQ